MKNYLKYIGFSFVLVWANTALSQVKLSVTTIKNVSCYGLSDGSVELTAQRGRKPYTFSKGGSTYSSNNLFSNLGAGNYTFYVKDNLESLDSISVSVQEPKKIEYKDSLLLPTCPKSTNGGIFLNALEGGTGSYNFLWNSSGYVNSFTTRNLFQIKAGRYFLKVTDANGCSYLDTLNLIAEFPISYNLVTDNITCSDKKDGKLSLKATETSNTTSINWKGPNNFSSNQKNINGLEQGLYTFELVDDTSGCKIEGQSFIQRPSKLESSIKTKRDVLCFGDSNGLILPQVIGGTLPYIYEWVGPNNFKSNKDRLVNGRKGAYILYLTDIQGCTDTLTANLSEPNRLLVASSVAPVSCFGKSDGYVKLTVNGALKPYDFQWSNGVKNSEINKVGAGDYEVIVTDSNGCVTTSKYKVETPALIEIDYNKSDISCFGKDDGRFTLIVSGGNFPLNYNITTPDLQIINTVNNRNVKPGIYKVKVTDSKQCRDSSEIEIVEPKKLSISPETTNAFCFGLKGSLGVSVFGGTSPYSYQWLDSNGSLYSATQNVVTAEVGKYYLTVKDANLCTVDDTVEILQPGVLNLAIVNRISPSCILDSTGSIKLSASGGTKPYKYRLNTNSFIDTPNFDKLGVGQYNLFVEDFNRCVDTVSINIRNLDTIAPEIFVQNVKLYLDNSGTARLNSSQIDTGSFDNCGISSFVLSKGIFSCAELGVNKVYIDVVDLSGNISKDSVEVTVFDTIKPDLKLKTAKVYLDLQGSGNLFSADVDNGTSDNCDLDSFLMSKSLFSCTELGLNSVLVSATDNSGNKIIDSVQVNVYDTLAPVIKFKNINAYLNNTGTVSVSPADVDAGSTDNCAILSRNLDNNRFSCLNLGNNFVNYTIADASNNKATGLVRITVLDTVSPIVRTKPITLFLNSFGFAVLKPEDIDNNSYDNCRISSMVLGQSVYTCADLGEVSTVLIITDASGNTARGNVKVTVRDTLLPNVITRNPTVYLDFNGNGVLSVFEVDKGSNDNCKLESVSISQDKFLCADLGEKNLVFTAKDASGNSSSGNFKAFIVDSIPPFVQVRNKDIYLNDLGMARVDPTYFDVGTRDNCTLKSTSISQTDFNEDDLGNNILLFTAFDQSNNRSVDVLNFRVYDTISPVINIKKQVRYLDANGSAKISVSEIIGDIRDNCSIKAITLSDSTFDCQDLGTFEVFVTAIDVANNKTVRPFILELNDTINPVIITKTAYIIIDTVGLARLKVADVIDNIVENCELASITLSQSVFGFTDEGDNFIQVQGKDKSNNNSISYWVKVVVSLGDSDLDSIPDYVETGLDFDGDGIPNYLDKDSDNDGILDVVENAGLRVLLDLDRDGFYNIYDLDSDGDGIFDVIESDGFDVEPFDGRIGIGKVTVNSYDGIPVLANEGLGQIPIDTENDNVYDFLDVDSDDDLILDKIERGNNSAPIDSDGDKLPNYRDSDSDNDGISDLIETNFDFDRDGIPNYLDLDSDNDEISDQIETINDKDLDDFGNWIDLDSDGDGIPDLLETNIDSDKDGSGNWLDLDSDNDGIPDRIEGIENFDGDSEYDFLDLDSDNDLIPDSIEGKPIINGLTTDTDGDGFPDFRDLDSDDDGIFDDWEGYDDMDLDQIPNFRDLDSDNDGITDELEGTKDLDSDGIPNYLDRDSDGDGIWDYIETFTDVDGDRVPNCYDLDSDNDGINDLRECGFDDIVGSGLIPQNDTLKIADMLRDFDNDGLPNFLDLDSDGDGIFDIIESGNLYLDEDGNGLIDDKDSDGDGIVDAEDGFSGAFGDYFDPPLLDSDYDGIFDFEDLDSDDDAIPDEEEGYSDDDYDFYPNYRDEDSDDDGIPDKVETNADFDNDGIPNYLDLDSDNDNLLDELEAGDLPEKPIDNDGDGDADYLDIDSDNDGVSDLEEGVVDNDKNGKPDYLDPQLFVPEIFSPNGDGINEYLIIRGLNNFPNATIQVFNQWGQIVFDSKGPYENNWSGDYRPEGSSNIGAVLSEGVYFYIVNYNQATANTQKIIKGNIYIKP